MNTSSISPALRLAPLALALAACSGDDAATAGSTTDAGTTAVDTDTTTAGADLLAVDGACLGPVDAPTRLAVITTDFASGGLSVADVAARSVAVDVAAATTDTVATWYDGKLYLVHRYGYNRLDAVDGATWALLGGVDVDVDAGVAEPNPQALAVADDGRGYLTLLGAPEVQVFDLSGDAPKKTGALDLSAFADDDGSPEAGVAIACGSYLVVGIQRLVDFTPVDVSSLVVLDRRSGAVVDLDPATPGDQGIPLAGAWPRQIRVDPADPSGHTLLVLTTGLERVHLPTATREWAIPDTTLIAAGITGFAPQAFALDATGDTVYLAAGDGEYPSAAVWRIAADAAPEKIIGGIATSEKVLERVGDELWVGDTTPGSAGLRVFDLGAATPAEITATPLGTGLPPYTILAIP